MSRIITLQKSDKGEYYTASFQYNYILKEHIKHGCRGRYNPKDYTWSFSSEYLDTLQQYANENDLSLYFIDNKKIIIHLLAYGKNSYIMESTTRTLLFDALNEDYGSKTFTKYEIRSLIRNLFHEHEHDGFSFRIEIKRIPIGLRLKKTTYDLLDIFRYDELYEFQKQTIDFMAERNFTALIADEMGSGKTCQTITIAQAAKSKKNIVICPLNAISVWEKEIKLWSTVGTKIQRIKDKKTKINDNVQWYIVNYEMLVIGEKEIQIDETLSEKMDKKIKKRFTSVDNIRLSRKKCTKNAKNIQYIIVQSGIADLKQISFMKKFDLELYNLIIEANSYFMHNDITQKLIKMNPTTLILDEAHNVKNPEAKKSIKVGKIAKACKYKIVLTGTPILNDKSDAEQLIRIILGDERYNHLDNFIKGDKTKTILEMLMVRRKKQEIGIPLPEKIREWVEIPIQDGEKVKEVLLEYRNILEKIKKDYSISSIDKMKITQESSNNLMRLRRLSGEAKVYTGQVSLYIANIVENCGSCCAFLYHTAAINELKEQLVRNKYRVEIIDGRVKSNRRKEIIEQFQAGEIDVLLLNGKSAKEGITLTRSYNFVFVEFDWVPGYMEQAEDRGHRIGQESEHYFIHYLYSSELEVDLIMRKILERKQKHQNEMMNDNVSFKYDNKRFILDLLNINRDVVTVNEPDESVTVDEYLNIVLGKAS